MYNEYAREIEAGQVIAAMKEVEHVPPFSRMGGRIPNDIAPAAHIKIRDRDPELNDAKLAGDMMAWAWPEPGGKPVVNFVSEKALLQFDRLIFVGFDQLHNIGHVPKPV